MTVGAQNNIDSIDIYNQIQEHASKYKVTQWMYDAVFTDHREVIKDTAFFVKGNRTVNPYTPYKGRIIRNIFVEPLDPFGYSANDTLYAKPGKFERLGNNFHVSTQKNVIRNLLLFKKNKPLDPLEISESERLLRLSPYVNDAHIYIRRIKGGDSVDVIVVEQDKWTTLAGVGIDGDNVQLNLVERNFFGVGHQFEENLFWDNLHPRLSSSGKYSVFNIRKSFITASLFYSDLAETKNLGFSLDRTFYSPLAKWAGGLLLTRNFNLLKQTVNGDVNNIKKYERHFTVQDFWVAKSYHLTESKQAKISQRAKSYITGARYFQVDFFDGESFVVDSSKQNRDQTMWLFNLGFTQRKYYRDRYLFRFGANEDIPQGVSAEVILGTSKWEQSSLLYYNGVKFGAGKHFEKIGYISGGFSYGTFYNSSSFGAGVLNINGFYFSDLIQTGRWFFRGFSRFQLEQGFNREPYQSVNINGIQMYGFKSPSLTGKSKMVLNFEFVLYAPYELIGFKLAPILLCGLGTLGNNLGDLFNTGVYQAYALGLLIRNEHLIVNTFELSIGLYPFVPGKGDFILRLNPISYNTVRAADFIVGKPDLVPY
ncbi:MAG: hypothetical protein H7296_12410 [Bacteroidia bacterium]|nr:hypothetical protein [Bacteroidia bacterium]